MRLPVELDHHRRWVDYTGPVIIAVPAAWSMAFVPSKRTKDILLWMLSTKDASCGGRSLSDLPAVHPTGLLDSRGSCRRADADQPADHRLDALHLFQAKSPVKSWKPLGWTERR